MENSRWCFESASPCADSLRRARALSLSLSLSCVCVSIHYRGRGFSFWVPRRADGQRSAGHRWPFGPVALVTPFNFPLEIPFLQTMGALYMGNKLVLKADQRHRGAPTTTSRGFGRVSRGIWKRVETRVSLSLSTLEDVNASARARVRSLSQERLSIFVLANRYSSGTGATRS